MVFGNSFLECFANFKWFVPQKHSLSYTFEAVQLIVTVLRPLVCEWCSRPACCVSMVSSVLGNSTLSYTKIISMHNVDIVIYSN